jgi:hypothetical protein
MLGDVGLLRGRDESVGRFVEVVPLERDARPLAELVEVVKQRRLA